VIHLGDGLAGRPVSSGATVTSAAHNPEVDRPGWRQVRLTDHIRIDGRRMEQSVVVHLADGLAGRPVSSAATVTSAARSPEVDRAGCSSRLL
jgi:2,3-bisphosphoglycerate-independent phosphoglycerate mutase